MNKIKRKLYLMFARKKGNKSEAVPVPSIVSSNTKIVGDMISKGIIHVDGVVEGDVTCEELIIGIRGSVVGAVTSNELQIYGLLQGKAKVDNLFIAKTAKLIGDARHNSIAIEPGAYIDGHCIHNRSGSDSASNATPAKEAEAKTVSHNNNKK